MVTTTRHSGTALKNANKPDFSVNDKETSRKYMKEQLELATKRLNELAANGTDKQIVKVNEIITNLTQALNRIK